VETVAIEVNCRGCHTPLSTDPTQAEFMRQGCEVRVFCQELGCNTVNVIRDGRVNMAYFNVVPVDSE